MSSAAIVPKSEIRKVLIVRLGAMGDVVHALPSAALLRRELPEAEIHWLIEPRWAPLLEGSPDIDRVVPAPLKRWQAAPFSLSAARPVRQTIAGLRAERYDLALDLQGLVKSAVVARLSGARRIAGFDATEARESLATRLYTDRFSTGRPHVVERYHELARLAVGGSDAEIRCALPPGEPSDHLPAGDFVLASPLAGWKSKQWPPERYAELAARLWKGRRIPLLLDCAPGDLNYCQGIAGKAPAGACVLRPSTIPQLIAATRRAAAVVGVDSGPLHIAAALERPGVALYGPTDPVRNGPHGGSFVVLRDSSARTSYKREHGFSPSMRALTVDRVWSSLEPLVPAGPRMTADVGD